MKKDQIIDWITKNTYLYSGMAKQLSISSQNINVNMKIILNHLSSYLIEFISLNKSVIWQSIGIFSVFEKMTKQTNFKNIIVGCFIPSIKWKNVLLHYKHIDTKNSSKISYEHLDMTQLSYRCKLNKELIILYLKAFSKAVIDLTELGKSLNIDLGVLKLNVIGKKLSFNYFDSFIQKLQQSKQQKQQLIAQKLKQRRFTQARSSLYQQIWEKNILGGLIERPNARQIQKHYDQGLYLKLKLMALQQSGHS